MANTPFLDLVKPAGTDHALVSVINSNSDKIDGGVSTLSEQIGAINTALRPSNANWINNANANNYTTTGQFLIGSGGTNFPDGWGILTVIANRPDIILQEYERANIVYVREFRDNAWSAWRQLALNENGTWTPTIERATTANKTGKYQKIGNLYICTFSFDLSAIEAGAPYILGSSLPGYSSATFTAIEGNWSSTGNEYGGMGNTSNNNVWFSKNGAVYGLPSSVNCTVRGVLTYMV